MLEATLYVFLAVKNNVFGCTYLLNTLLLNVASCVLHCTVDQNADLRTSPCEIHAPFHLFAIYGQPHSQKFCPQGVLVAPGGCLELCSCMGCTVKGHPHLFPLPLSQPPMNPSPNSLKPPLPASSPTHTYQHGQGQQLPMDGIAFCPWRTE